LGGETAEEGGKEREGKRKNKEKKKKRRKETQVPCAAIPSIFWINDPNKEEPTVVLVSHITRCMLIGWS
jgi:hypothetical protein